MIAHGVGIKRLKQALGQPGRVENRAQQQETTAGVFVACALDEHVTHLAIAYEAL
jgi:hypothetical protein